MVGDSLREALKNICIRTEFRIQVQTYSLRYVLLANYPYEELDQGENFCFHPGSKNRRTRNTEVGRNGKTMEQPKEERKYRTEHGQFAHAFESATFVSAKSDSAEM